MSCNFVDNSTVEEIVFLDSLFIGEGGVLDVSGYFSL
jgi:hypothetical protein